MLIRIREIKVDERSGVSNKTGRPYSIRTQLAEAETARYRAEVRLTMGEKADPWPVGEYELVADESIIIGRYGDLELTRVPSLRPVKALKAASAA